MTAPAPARFFTLEQVVAMVALVIAAYVSLGTLGTAALSGVRLLGGDSTTYFEEQIGRPLMAPALWAAGASLTAAALLLSTVWRRRPLLAWVSALLSVFAIVVALDATVEHRRRSDPRPELTRHIRSLDLGPDSTVVLRTSEALPDLPEVRWVYRVPLHKAEACARARAALEAWANPGTVSQGDQYACELRGARESYAVNVVVSPEGAPLTGPPDDHEDLLNTPIHYVLVQIGPCAGAADCSRAGV